ncbi:hypothetical protein HanXRQr2_Chr03g0100051 [Helianthus annuus]|uniref:Uncharacterized protein n=1 Tax=Helianthus annuus TaxID=4232 RepID=A0A9K3NVZ5_HELAN|nr:hypothetical protein HanXRQr2_Chr03g0100051 [Helianthus annuus]KAJ0599799.1 hypothetical protein HanIR_Chr03g0109181 [Helianthus annuus]KAJ0942789.1 hypothetical protein HanPSC8_Chr03g0096311 [Helianthus annuus]
MVMVQIKRKFEYISPKSPFSSDGRFTEAQNFINLFKSSKSKMAGTCTHIIVLKYLHCPLIIMKLPSTR